MLSKFLKWFYNCFTRIFKRQSIQPQLEQTKKPNNAENTWNMLDLGDGGIGER
jgi:hypothetical protein